MRKLIVVIILCLLGSLVYGQENLEALSIRQYVDRYLAHSAELDTAQALHNQSLETYETAMVGQQSAFDLGLLGNTHRLMQAEVFSTENSAVILAVQKVFSSFAAAASMSFAKTAEVIAAAEYDRAIELFRKDYISSAQLRSAHRTYLQAGSAVRAVSVEFLSARKALYRSIEEELANIEIPDFTKNFEFPDLPSVGWLVAQDAVATKFRTDLALHNGKQTLLASINDVAPSELAAVEDIIVQTSRLILQQTWLLQDTLDELKAQIEGNRQFTLIAGLNKEATLAELEQARHQFSNGDIHPSDLLRAELSHYMALEQIAALERDRFILILESLNLKNVRLRNWISDNLAAIK
jgi:hypothetical protein